MLSAKASCDFQMTSKLELKNRKYHLLFLLITIVCQNKEFLSEKSGSFIRNKLNAEINKPKFCQRAHIARFIGMNIAYMF